MPTVEKSGRELGLMEELKEERKENQRGPQPGSRCQCPPPLVPSGDVGTAEGYDAMFTQLQAGSERGRGKRTSITAQRRFVKLTWPSSSGGQTRRRDAASDLGDANYRLKESNITRSLTSRRHWRRGLRRNFRTVGSWCDVQVYFLQRRRYVKWRAHT
ncbi:hypothetical protein BaRGS_00001258, partial [Batillaria attramentaria]